MVVYSNEINAEKQRLLSFTSVICELLVKLRTKLVNKFPQAMLKEMYKGA